VENKLRYQLVHTAVHHPYIVRYNRSLQKTEPKVVPGAMIQDIGTKEIVRGPAMAGKIKHTDVREMNGLPAISIQKVIGVIRSAGYQISTMHMSRMVRGWSDRSSGAHVRYTGAGQIMIDEGIRNHDRRTEDQIRQRIAKYSAVLTAKKIEHRIAACGKIILI
jgi:hypothetical protein